MLIKLEPKQGIHDDEEMIEYVYSELYSLNSIRLK